MPSHLAVKVSFWGALEEVTIKKTLLFPFLGSICAGLLVSPSSCLEERLVIDPLPF